MVPSKLCWSQKTDKCYIRTQIENCITWVRYSLPLARSAAFTPENVATTGNEVKTTFPLSSPKNKPVAILATKLSIYRQNSSQVWKTQLLWLCATLLQNICGSTYFLKFFQNQHLFRKKTLSDENSKYKCKMWVLFEDILAKAAAVSPLTGVTVSVAALFTCQSFTDVMQSFVYLCCAE